MVFDKKRKTHISNTKLLLSDPKSVNYLLNLGDS